MDSPAAPNADLPIWPPLAADAIAGAPAGPSPAAAPMRFGIDLCNIGPVAEALACFGPRYLHRIYTPGEAAYALAVPMLAAERLAACFAAKEAAIKTFGLAEHGIAWTDIEVQCAADGSCTLALHGRAAEAAGLRPDARLAVSLSFDGGQAVAIVATSLPSDSSAPGHPPTEMPRGARP